MFFSIAICSICLRVLGKVLSPTLGVTFKVQQVTVSVCNPAVASKVERPTAPMALMRPWFPSDGLLLPAHLSAPRDSFRI